MECWYCVWGKSSIKSGVLLWGKGRPFGLSEYEVLLYIGKSLHISSIKLKLSQLNICTFACQHLYVTLIAPIFYSGAEKPLNLVQI